MTNPALLSPGLLGAVSFSIVGLTILLIAVHTALLALAARRAELGAGARVRVPLLAAVMLAAWAGWAITVVRSLAMAPEPPAQAGTSVQAPHLFLVMAAMVALGIVVLLTSNSIRTINATMPPAWLVGVQAYRVEGLIFLWPFLAAGALPAGFALPAGIGDVLTGIAAPFVALALARNRPGAYRRAVLWNWFGILDLVVATTTAVLTGSTNIARFPLVIVPLFLGPPLGILTHIYSLRNLRLNRGNIL